MTEDLLRYSFILYTCLNLSSDIVFLLLLHGCVFMLYGEIEILYPSALCNWPQFVLAKNLSKEEIVEYLYWLHCC